MADEIPQRRPTGSYTATQNGEPAIPVRQAFGLGTDLIPVFDEKVEVEKVPVVAQQSASESKAGEIKEISMSSKVRPSGLSAMVTWSAPISKGEESFDDGNH